VIRRRSGGPVPNHSSPCYALNFALTIAARLMLLSEGFDMNGIARSFAMAAALATLPMLAAEQAEAADFSFTGSFVGVNDVQFFDFSVGTLSDVTLRTWSYAGGLNAAGQSIARGGFDPILALFSLPTGALIGQNDDGGANVAPDAVTGARFDTFLTVSLAAGDYRVSVMEYANFAFGPNLSNGFTNGGIPDFFDVTGNQRTNNWAFDVLNVNSAVAGGVPEPSTWAMMLIGFAGLAFVSRRRETERATVEA